MKTWLRDTGYILAGALVTLAVFAVAHQVLFPALCAADGSVWAGWAQVVAIVGTGGAAVYVANRQLGAYNEALRASATAEKMRNTLAVADDVYKDFTIYEQMMSPMTATAVLEETAYVQDNLPVIQEKAAIMAEKRLTAKGDAQLLRVTVALAVVNNYFGGLWDLLQRDLVDTAFIMDRFSALAANTHAALKIINIRPSKRGFDEMAEASRQYQARTEASQTRPEPNIAP